MAESEMFENAEGPTTAAQTTVFSGIAVPLTLALLWLMFGLGQAPWLSAAVAATLVALLAAGFFGARRAFIARFYAVAAVGVPIWFVSALFVNLAPEFGKALGLTFDPKTLVSQVLAWQATGLALGSALSGIASESLHSRKRVLWLCLVALLGFVVVETQIHDIAWYVHLMFVVGLFQGYWTAFVTMAAEQFGVNVRATVSSSVPNIVRAMTVPVTLSVRGLGVQFGWTNATLLVGAIVFGLAFLGLSRLEETYGKNLDYSE